MKILLIGSELGYGGAEKSISLLSWYLERKFDVTLCILSGWERTRYYPTCQNVIFLDPPRGSNPFSKLRSWLFRLRKLRQLKRELGITVAVSFMEGPNYANALTRGSERVVLSVRSSKVYQGDFGGLSGCLQKAILIPLLYRSADAVVGNSWEIGEEMVTHFCVPRAKVHTVYNLFDIEKIMGLAQEPINELPRSYFEVPVLVASGRLHVQKGFDFLLKVFAALRARRKCRLLILGEGTILGDLVDQGTRLNLKVHDFFADGVLDQASIPDVCFLGYQSNPFKFFRNSNLMVLTSRWEGFPNVLAEAIICGTPVAAADCHTGPSEILNVRLPRTERSYHQTPYGILLPAATTREQDEALVDVWATQILNNLDLPPLADATVCEFVGRFSASISMQDWESVLG